MRDTIDLARAVWESGTGIYEGPNIGQLKRFEALVRADAIADERRANIDCIGRIAALVGDPIDQARLFEAIDAIRARGETKLKEKDV